jgi:hypothetical protein
MNSFSEPVENESLTGEIDSASVKTKQETSDQIDDGVEMSESRSAIAKRRRNTHCPHSNYGRGRTLLSISP